MRVVRITAVPQFSEFRPARSDRRRQDVAIGMTVEIPHHIKCGAHCDVAIHGVLLARSLLIHMNIGTTLSGLVLLCALAVVIGAATLIAPAHTPVGLLSSSEAAVLLLPGMGFVLLANRVRRTERC